MCLALLINESSHWSAARSGPDWEEAKTTDLFNSELVWTFDDAAADAAERVAAMAEATDPPRNYTPGQAGPNEAFCKSNFDNKFCNHLHGEWGDNIPQTDEWCAWAVLEFQDPSSDIFSYSGSGPDFTAFNTKFADVLASATDMMDAKDNETGILAVASGYGIRGSTANTDSPWPISSVIWRMGNKFAKPWITESHRPSAQCQGLRWGFTFYGHWKAVKCADVPVAMTAAGLSPLPGSTEAATTDPTHYGRVWGGNFRTFWNAFSIIDDHTETLACNAKSNARRLLGGLTSRKGKKQCGAYPGSDCTQAPCSLESGGDDPCPSRNDTDYTAPTRL